MQQPDTTSKTTVIGLSFAAAAMLFAGCIGGKHTPADDGPVIHGQAGTGMSAGTGGLGGSTAGFGGFGGSVAPDGGVGCAAIGASGGAAAEMVVLPGSAGFGGGVMPALPPTHQAETPPPPISGGTMLMSSDGKTLIAADPDRDRVYLINVADHSLRQTIELKAGDEPGRIVEDADGFAHIALRSSSALANIALDGGAVTRTEGVCDLPRGLAFDAPNGALQLACAEGKLVTLSLAAGVPTATRNVDLGRDLRDVIVKNGKLFVTRFKSAELLTVSADGKIMNDYTPPSLSGTTQQFEQTDACGNGNFTNVNFTQTPTVAWRALAVEGAGVMMVHQRSRADSTEISTTAGGYGSGFCADDIVQSAITMQADDGSKMVFPPLSSMTLPVDLAATTDGSLFAIVAPGNYMMGIMQVSVYAMSEVKAQGADPSKLPAASDAAPPLPADAGVAGAGALPFIPADVDAGGGVIDPGTTCTSAHLGVDVAGQATAVAFISPYELAVQTREPARIEFIDLRLAGTGANTVLDLKQASVFDTGHAIFHMRAGAGIACASCHAESGDDGHVWAFKGIGSRRTQHLRGGILGTEPFHWDGDQKDLTVLMGNVFVTRMSGFQTAPDQNDAIAHWIDKQPALHATPSDMAAVERGHALFTSDATGCTTCHSGTKLTNNQNADVGTGKALQVPSLRGVSFRAPFMHNGCAKTLEDRFGACGGGDKHGHTSDLTKAQLSDLVSYLGSL